MILPVAKLGALALKTVCKSIANRLKKEIPLHPTFRHCVIAIAQANHRFSTNVQRRIYGHATNDAIQPLDEEKAVQAAADIFGELFVFTVLGAYIIFEVHRSSRSEAKREELRRHELKVMKQRNGNIAQEIEILKHKVEELDSLAKERGLSGLSHFRPNWVHWPIM